MRRGYGAPSSEHLHWADQQTRSAESALVSLQDLIEAGQCRKALWMLRRVGLRIGQALEESFHAGHPTSIRRRIQTARATAKALERQLAARCLGGR